MHAWLSREKLQVPADKPFITLSGTLASNTIITWGDSGEIIQSATLSVFASYFVARSLTVQVCVWSYVCNVFDAIIRCLMNPIYTASFSQFVSLVLV